jgi:DnaJ domain/Protein of unknown function (DUF1232)
MRILLYLLTVLYVISPFDLVPDFLVGAGWIDDLILLGVLGWYHFVYRKRKAYRDPYYEQGQSTGQRRRAFKEEKNPYEVLGVGNRASIQEIKGAYRRLSRQYHPDRVTHLGEEFRVLAEERFKEIQRAYQEINKRFKV